VRWSKLLLGDWTRWIRDPLDVIRLTFLTGAVVLAVIGRSTAISLSIAAMVVIVTRFVNLPRVYDLAVLVGTGLIAWGTAFNLYGRFHHYDKVVHFLAPGCYAPVLYIIGIRLSMLPDLKDSRERHLRIGIFFVTLALGMAISAGYEICEFAIDRFLGGHLKIGEADTAGDLLAGTIGSAIGGALLVLWSVSGFETVRRLPPTAARRRM
jgi:hypothetical protein